VEEFGPSCEYAPAALRFKPESAALESGLTRHVAQNGGGRVCIVWRPGSIYTAWRTRQCN
jgi:hypothetical protein